MINFSSPESGPGANRIGLLASSSRRALSLALMVPLLSVACDNDDKAAGESTAQSVAASVSAAPPEPPKPWYFGEWTGSYDSAKFEVTLGKDTDKVKAWEEDEGKIGSGKGSLTLEIDESGRALGSATGPLGSMIASGNLEGESLRVRLTPKDAEAQPHFSGFLIAKREKAAFKGEIQASSGDSTLVRRAPIVLEKPATTDEKGSKPAAPAPKTQP